MTRPLAAALLLVFLPWGAADGPPVSVSRLPEIPPPCEVGTLGPGAVFEAPGGDLCMVVSPAREPGPPYVLYGAVQIPDSSWYAAQLELSARSLTRWDVAILAGTPGVATLDLSRDVYVVLIRYGTLVRMPADTWARPVVARVGVTAGPRED